MQQEEKFKKVLYNQVSLFIALVGVVSSVLFWLTNPQVELATRVSAVEKDLTFIADTYENEEQNQSESLSEIKDRLKSVEEHQLNILQAVARLEAK